MTFRLFKSALLRVVIGLIALGLIVGVIGLARGYRLDLKTKTFSPTGILAVTSSPKAAKVYLDGELKGVTDLNMTLPPGNYTVEVKKDGYTSYKTTVVLKGELVQTVDPLLFPINPSLSPLTNLGIVKAIQVDQSDRVIILSQDNPEGKDGIYLFDSGNKPLSFFPPLKSLLLKKNLPEGADLSKTTVYFSYDYKQAIFEFPFVDGTSIAYLLSLDTENQEPFDVTSSKKNLLQAWKVERDQEMQKIIESFPREIQHIASSSFEILAFSPDQTKILYRANKAVSIPQIIIPPLIASRQTVEERGLKARSIYIYDQKEDKNFKIGDGKFDSAALHWYPDSKHLVFKEGNLISLFDYDGTNKQTVYSGPIEENFFAVNSGGQIMILANLNPQSNKFPDLYQVGIR